MNICKKLFTTLMVLTTLVYCENGYTMENTTQKEVVSSVDNGSNSNSSGVEIPKTEQMEPWFSIQDFSLDENRGKGLAKCKVIYSSGIIETNTDEQVKYNDKPCYELKTLVETISQTKDGNVVKIDTDILPDEANLIVGDIKSSDYTITTAFASTFLFNNTNYKCLCLKIMANKINIIIPHGVTIHQKNIVFDLCGNDINFIIRGTLDNRQQYYEGSGQDYPNSLFYFHKKANVFIGATAKINFNNVNHDPMFGLESSDSIVLLYPGCEIDTTNYQNDYNSICVDEDNYRSVIKSQRTLYLNKYQSKKAEQEDYEAIKGTISKGMNVIFPSQPAHEYEFIYKINDIDENKIYDNTQNTHFPNLYWMGGSHSDDKKGGIYKLADYGNNNQYDTDLSIKNKNKIK